MAAGDEVTEADLVARRVRFVDPADLDRYFPADDTLPRRPAAAGRRGR